MEIQSTPKRLRALPRVWQRFVYLEPGDCFFIGRCRYVKAGFFKAVTAFEPGRTIRVMPWHKVQTDVLVRDARPGGKSSVVVEMDAARERVDAVVNDGITNYADKPVNNDNNITGPTS